MTFRSEFAKAVKLFFLLSLLFWSFTWNLSKDFDWSCEEPQAAVIQKGSKDVSYGRSDVTVFTNQYSVLIESFSTVRHESRKSSKSVSTSGYLIPSFNEWKEQEMTKYERGSSKDGSFHHPRNLIRRKLNYASSKCGAKILASNPEARHRIAVLSEKSDEYMLNPCRVRTWFVVELCDTVEATQVELANYELYSSSPREFSVLWSEVYPAPVWHLLGTFEAKDQRTMQTFDLSTKNLGKFIKVVIYNHHGREHYCPLSVMRVLGYSMVQKLEDIEDEENNPDSALDNPAEIQSDENALSKEEPISQERITGEFRNVSNINSNLFSVKTCSLFFMHCSTKAEALCLNEPKCRFLVEVMNKSGTNCHEVFCPKSPKASFTAFKATYQDKSKDVLSNLTVPDAEKANRSSHPRDILKDYEYEKSLKISKETNDFIPDENSTKYEDVKATRRNSSIAEKRLKVENISTVDAKAVSVKSTDPILPTEGKVQEKCVCEKDKKTEDGMLHGDAVVDKKFAEELNGNDDAIDSAGLILKESVLFKLTSRIKSSEMDLNLINRYLQQLSQSYRQQMEDMKTMFNHTVKAISIASEKAEIIDKKQEESISVLTDKMKILSRKIDYLMNGQRDVLKRVVELHGFFLILEFIIISTIFTAFLNIFRRKNNAPVEDR